ncbi:MULTISPECIES: YigZ family protein [Bacillaceae]|uniref:YigZ family protein n=1 Tax=Evansella alkalicola TaxID=745819 RepID=A0ABS6JUH8_9BACI|nr:MULTISPECIES: YigZ family protein [Bacillaceae]MBU9721741.1 YigZ family protein [Bacillus alkalicola]
MLSSYYTVKENKNGDHGIHEIVIQKSRFIAHIKRVTSEEDAQAFIEKIKKEHWNANHNCSAYMIGENDQIQKANDDGEPSGTAGVPILEVLKKRHLKDTVVVITRYFGGIKLGAGGLIRAYGSATSEGITANGVVERRLAQRYKLTIDYHFLGKVENELHSSPYIIDKMDYVDQVQIEVLVYVGEEASFEEWFTNLTSGQGKLEKISVQYLEKDIGQ